MADHEDKVAAAHLRFAVDDDFAAKLFDDAIHQVGADFFVGHFATAEDNHDFYPIAIFEELEDFAAFNIEVILPNLQTKSNLFEFAAFGVFLSATLFFHLLVLVFTPIDDFNNWRICIWRYLYQIKSRIACSELSIATRHDAKLRTVSTNYTNLGMTDFSVNASVRIVDTDGFAPFKKIMTCCDEIISIIPK